LVFAFRIFDEGRVTFRERHEGRIYFLGEVSAEAEERAVIEFAPFPKIEQLHRANALIEVAANHALAAASVNYAGKGRGRA